MILLLLIIGSFFCLAAAATAFLITLNEYLHGRNPDRRLALWIAFKAGFITLIIFTALIVGIGFVLNKILG
jgi:hypothetical protein